VRDPFAPERTSSTETRELVARDRLETVAARSLPEAEVEGEAPDCGFAIRFKSRL